MTEVFHIPADMRVESAYYWPDSGDCRCFALCGLVTASARDFALCLPMPEPFVGRLFSVLPAETPALTYIVDTTAAHFAELCVTIGEKIREFVVRTRSRIRMSVRSFCARVRKIHHRRL